MSNADTQVMIARMPVKLKRDVQAQARELTAVAHARTKDRGERAAGLSHSFPTASDLRWASGDPGCRKRWK